VLWTDCLAVPEAKCEIGIHLDKPDLVETRDQYVKALYWSLTTMTTIGYGDIGPSTQDEIFYVLIAEVRLPPGGCCAARQPHAAVGSLVAPRWPRAALTPPPSPAMPADPRAGVLRGAAGADQQALHRARQAGPGLHRPEERRRLLPQG
jgi:hypothetical protein